MTATNLLPCPFCGGEAHTYKNNLWHVACERAHNNCVTMSAFITEAEAIAAWNTRSVTAAAVMGYEAAQAERTCTNASYRLDESRFHCSECGFGCWVKDVADGRDKLPTYCPNCGAKVVER